MRVICADVDQFLYLESIIITCEREYKWPNSGEHMYVVTSSSNTNKELFNVTSLLRIVHTSRSVFTRINHNILNLRKLKCIIISNIDTDFISLNLLKLPKLKTCVISKTSGISDGCVTLEPLYFSSPFIQYLDLSTFVHKYQKK